MFGVGNGQVLTRHVRPGLGASRLLDGGLLCGFGGLCGRLAWSVLAVFDGFAMVGSPSEAT